MIERGLLKGVLIVAGLGLAACAQQEPPPPAPAAAEPTWQALGPDQLAGRTLYLENGAVITLNPDGTFTGMGKGGAPAGTWVFQNGEFCFDTLAGAADLPSGCYVAETDGSVGRMVGEGRTIRFDV